MIDGQERNGIREGTSRNTHNVVAELLFEGSICRMRPLSRKSLAVNLKRLRDIPILHASDNIAHMLPVNNSLLPI